MIRVVFIQLHCVMSMPIILRAAVLSAKNEQSHSLFVMWFQLGVVMFERGIHKEALQNFEHALHIDPKHNVCLADILRNIF